MSTYMELFYPASEPAGWMDYGSRVSDSSHYYPDSYGRSYSSQSAVVMHVPMCCENCVKKVRKSIKNVEAIDSVEVDMPRQRVIVRGYASPERVLRKIQKVKKTASFWERSHDYAYYNTGAYDYHRPSSSSGFDYDYYSPSSSAYDYDYGYGGKAYDYGYNYPVSHYGRHGNHHQHHSSYDAYRYR